MKRLLLTTGPILLAALALAVVGMLFQRATAAAPVLVADNFEDGNADGWTVQAGDWWVSATHTYRQISTTVDSRAFVGSPEWSDYAVQAKVMLEEGTFAMLMARVQDSKNYYFMTLRSNGQVQLRRYVGGSSTTLPGTVNPGIKTGTWYLAELEVQGNTLRAIINGTPVITATDSTFITGTAGVGASKGVVEFDDVLITDRAGTPYLPLYADDFEDGNADGWTEQAGIWSVASNYVYKQTNMSSDTRSYTGDPTWTDYSIASKVKIEGGTYAMLITRWQDKDNHYFMAIRSNGNIEIKRRFNASSGSALGTAHYTFIPGLWYDAMFEANGSTLRAYLNGTAVLTVTDATFAAGSPAVGASKANVEFDDVLITDLRFFTLTVGTIGSGAGVVTDTSGALDCGITCTAAFESASVVTLTATPGSGDTFAGWMGACSGAGDCVVTMDAHKNVMAVFSADSNPMLVVTKAGSGTGSVLSDPAGIDCGETCAAAFEPNAVVTLTATPAGNATFAGWSGACTGEGACVVTMDTAKNVVATFDMTSAALTVAKDGNGTGAVLSDPAGIDCGVTCTAEFAYGAVVTLTATPEAMSEFAGWSGACSGVDTCVVTITANQSVTATFNLIRYPLQVNRAGNGMGSVLSDPAGINHCSRDVCTAEFDYGTVVTLTATANPLSSFGGWNGEGCSGTGACAVTLDMARTVTVTFNSFALYLPLIIKGGDGPVQPTLPDFSLTGYATISGTTTGGAGGAVVTVTTLSDLQQYAAATEPMIIQVDGLISDTAVVTVTSNKTIVGVGSSGELYGVELNIRAGISNVIIRNLKVSHVPATNRDGDAIHIQGPGTHHIWIDHCDLSGDLDHYKDFYDGLLDISHEVDYVTVSWNVFHDHFKGSLVGHSDENAAEDTGHFLVTYHHNYFRDVNSRMPSNRFGTVHVYNNYYNNENIFDWVDANTAVSSRMGACTRVENNAFESIRMPVMTDQSIELGAVQLIGNLFTNCTGYATTPTCELTPPYTYTLHTARETASIVTQYAGVGVLEDALDQ
ncbi:MAG: hypothetical protein JXA21_05715 [Anaerolineae bacterium]|nr:hypothetical protein [Anaerolineae bacterium]